MRRISMGLWLVIATLGAACTDVGSLPGPGGGSDSPGGGDDAPGSGDVTYYRDVLPVVQARCAACHTDGGAAFALDTYAAAAPLASAMAASVMARRMPPWPPDRLCGEFEGQEGRRLEEHQMLVFERWLQAGTPAGDPADAPAAPGPAADTLGPPDLTLDPGATYSFANTSDDLYWCFRLPGTIAAGTDLTALDITPGNEAVVHHVIVFKEPGGAGKARGLPGFECGGVPPRTDFLFGWVPGARPAHFPPGMGMRLEPTDALVMQIHYHKSAKAGPEEDRTRLRLWTAKTPVAEHLRVIWTGSIDINVPAGGTATASGTCTIPAGSAPVKVVSVAPHMHTVGTSFRSTVQRAGGGETCLVDIPRWDFEWQGGYQYKQPLTLAPGDTIHTTCSYRNGGSAAVGFGEGTGDEMCFDFVFVVDDGKLPEKCFAPCNVIDCDALGF